MLRVHLSPLFSLFFLCLSLLPLPPPTRCHSHPASSLPSLNSSLPLFSPLLSSHSTLIPSLFSSLPPPSLLPLLPHSSLSSPLPLIPSLSSSLLQLLPSHHPSSPPPSLARAVDWNLENCGRFCIAREIYSSGATICVMSSYTAGDDDDDDGSLPQQ